jgi:hypothetical protein
VLAIKPNTTTRKFHQFTLITPKIPSIYIDYTEFKSESYVGSDNNLGAENDELAPEPCTHSTSSSVTSFQVLHGKFGGRDAVRENLLA